MITNDESLNNSENLPEKGESLLESFTNELRNCLDGGDEIKRVNEFINFLNKYFKVNDNWFLNFKDENLENKTKSLTDFESLNPKNETIKDGVKQWNNDFYLDLKGYSLWIFKKAKDLNIFKWFYIIIDWDNWLTFKNWGSNYIFSKDRTYYLKSAIIRQTNDFKPEINIGKPLWRIDYDDQSSQFKLK